MCHQLQIVLLLGSETSPQGLMIRALGTQAVKSLGGSIYMKEIRHQGQLPEAGLHSLLPVHHDVNCQQLEYHRHILSCLCLPSLSAFPVTGT